MSTATERPRIGSQRTDQGRPVRSGAGAAMDARTVIPVRGGMFSAVRTRSAVPAPSIPQGPGPLSVPAEHWTCPLGSGSEIAMRALRMGISQPWATTFQ